MRNISVNALAEIAKQNGARPVIFLDIQWKPNGQYVRYSDAIVAGAIHNIKSIDTIDTGVNITGSSFGISCSVVLLDPDGEIKRILDTSDIHKRPCRIMQWFQGLPLSDAFEIFRGQISSPVSWSEGTREVSFTILDQLHSRDVGFSLEQGQYAYVSDEIVGQSWPVCFGEVLNVPAVKAIEVPTATATTMFGIPDPTLDLKRFQIETDLRNYEAAYSFYMNMVYGLQMMVTPGYVTKQKLVMAGDAGPKSAYTLEYKGQLVGVFEASTDALVIQNAVAAIAPEWLVSGGAKNLTFDFTFDPNQYKTRAIALLAIKPAMFSITVFQPVQNGPIKATCRVTPIKVYVDSNEIDYTSYETMIYTRARQLQLEYVDVIIAEDKLKQEIENLNLELDTTNKIYDEALRANEAGGDPQIEAKLKEIGAVRDAYTAVLNKKTVEFTSTSHNKGRLDVDIHNLKFVFEAIKNIQKKITQLLENYTKLGKRYMTLLRIIDQQEKTLIDSCRVNDADQFERDKDVEVNIKGVKIRGQFNQKNEFTRQTVLPNYEDIDIVARQSDDLDYFWIDDPNNEIDLTNMYCKIQDDRIIYVTEQKGNRCKFDLIQYKSNIRSSPDDYTFAGMNDSMIKSAFDQATYGDETPEQLRALAQTIPKDLSPKIYERLRGGASKEMTQIFRTFMPGNIGGLPVDVGSYRLSYDGKQSLDILCSATETEILAALKTILPAEITPTIETWVFKRSAAKKNWKKAYDDAKRDTKGVLSFQNADCVEYRIKLKLNTVLKTKHPVYPIYPIRVVDPVDDFNQRQQPTNAGPMYAKVDVKGHMENKRVYADTYPVSLGAHEHTINKIISKIESAIVKSAHADELKILQKKINDWSQLLAIYTQEGDAKNIKTARDAVAQFETKYAETLALVNVPESVYAEAYRLISDTEFKALFKLELLHFLAWRHSLAPISAYVPDPHTEYFIVGTDIKKIKAASPIIIDTWLKPYKSGSKADIMQNMLTLPSSEAFIVEPGTEIKQYGDFQEIFACNIMPSQIKAVRAFKSVNGQLKLLDLPERYYEKNENDNYGRFTLTSITLRKPLVEYRDEDWQDGIYVSLVSSVGPNPIDIIGWVLQRFSNLSLDSESANYLRTKLANYPCHFALLNPIDALTLVKDIAYQSRCASWVKQDTVHLQYLSEPGTNRYTFSEDNVDFGTLVHSYTDSDFVTTKYTAEWQYDYSKKEKFKTILRYNVGRFDEQPEVVDYYTLTDQGLVEKTATFWLIRKSNIWKVAKFSAPLDSMNLEPFDTVTLNFAGNYFTNGPVQGIVQSANYNAKNNAMDFEIWLPVRAGEMSQYVFAWPAGLSAGTTYPLDQDILSGNAGDPFSDQVPTGLNYDPFAFNPTNIRPKDYGDITPTDLTDSQPKSPLEEVTPAGELPPKPENFEPDLVGDLEEDLQPNDLGGGGEAGPGLASVFLDSGPAAQSNVVVGQGEQGQQNTKVMTVAGIDKDRTDSSIKLSNDSYQAIAQKPLDSSIKDIKTQVTWYSCQDERGHVFPVEMSGLHPDDTIPAGTRILANYKEAFNRWEGMIPTYINTKDTPVS